MRKIFVDLEMCPIPKESFEVFQEKVLDCFRPKAVSHTMADLFDFSAFQTVLSGT